MMTAKVFENGRSQAVRLPKEYRFSEPEVSITKVGDIVMLLPKNNPYEGFLLGLNMFSDDFMKDGRANQLEQKRETL